MNWFLLFGSIFGASGVLLGAYGAHGLTDLFAKFPEMKKAYTSALDFQMYHSLLLVFLGGMRFTGVAKISSILSYLLIGSISLFSGSIYIWVWGGPSWLLRLTPIGGVGFFLSWVMLAWMGWANRKT